MGAGEAFVDWREVVGEVVGEEVGEDAYLSFDDEVKFTKYTRSANTNSMETYNRKLGDVAIFFHI